MRLKIVRGGGVAGLTTRTELSAESLPAEAAEKFAEKFVQADVLELAEGPPSARRQPDELLYEITAEDAGRSRTLHFGDGSLPESLRVLIAWVDSRPEREHEIEGPTGPP